MKKRMITAAGILALVIALLCGVITVAAAEDAVTVQFLSMENGIADLNVCVSAGDKLVDYAQLVIKTDAAGVALVPEATTDTAGNPRIEARGNDDGTMTVLVERADTSFAGIAGGDVLIPFRLSGTTNRQELNVQVSYILCYTDGSTAEGTVTAPVTITGNITSRLEAETDSVYWLYGNIESNKAGDGKEVGGVWDSTSPDAYRQSFDALAGGEELRKAGNPMMSFIVDVAEEGDYSLDVVFRGNQTAGSLEDFFVALCVDDVANSYVKAFCTGAHPTISGYNIANGTVHLTEGRHVIRVITMLSDTRTADVLYMKWLNVDFVDVKGPGVLTPVAPQWTHLNANQASTIVNFVTTTNTTLDGGYENIADWWANPLGGYRGDNYLKTSEGFTLDSLSKLGYFAYTVNVPADGFYDMQTYIRCNWSKTFNGSIIMIVDEEIHKFPAISPQSYVNSTKITDIIKWNAQNLSCYLTKGTHTIVVSGIIDQDQTISNWCDIGSLSVSGGITIEGVTQIAPQSISITKTGNTLVLENMVQNKYQFSVEGVTLAANENNSGLLVWRGEDIAAANGVYEFGTQSYVVNNLSAVDGTIKALGIAAKEQGDDIVARGFVMDANGKYYYSEVIDFKATTYASAVFAENADTSLVLARPTVAAMLNYFGKAQKLFGHAGNGYMDEIQIPTGIDLTYDASYRIALAATPEHFTSDTYRETIFHSLELEDNVYIKYIVPKGSKTSAPTLLIWEQDEAITLDNATRMPMGVNGSYYTASISGIAPKDMGKTFFVSIYDATTGKYSQLDAYSIHQYAGNMITKYAEDSSQAELVDLCKALLTYSYMAKNYFASLNADVVYVSNAGTVYNSGATAADATDWETALYKVKNGGTIYMDNYLMAADETWPAHTKSVTLQGSLNASAQTTLNINGPTTFGAVTLSLADSAEVYANGYKVTVSGDATVDANTANNAAPLIFGGAAAGSSHVTTTTDLTVLTGKWTGIYGGGGGSSAGAAPTVTTANLVVGGNVNTGLDISNHDLNNHIYGGSRRGAVGTINLTVGGSARAIQVHGGGSGISGADWCDFTETNVTIQDNVVLMGIHGGNNFGAGSNKGCTINITVNGGTIDQIFGGHRNANARSESEWKLDLNGDGDTSDSSTVNLIGNINITLNGGSITRRVYGGSYNNTSSTGKHVYGTITLCLNEGADFTGSYGYTEDFFAGSRYCTDTTKFADEVKVIIYGSEAAKDKFSNDVNTAGTTVQTLS